MYTAPDREANCLENGTGKQRVVGPHLAYLV